jgi:transcriptional regulator with XRE-family HTH domain
MTNQAAGENPLKVFGAMLAYYRNRVGMTPEQLGARVYLSGSQIRKVEAGTRTPSADLAKACEAITELGCNGALTELYEILSMHLKRRVYPGWFAGWPDKEAQARRLRWFEPLVVPGLLQTEAYARAILSTRMGATREELDEAVAGYRSARARTRGCGVAHSSLRTSRVPPPLPTRMRPVQVRSSKMPPMSRPWPSPGTRSGWMLSRVRHRSAS